MCICMIHVYNSASVGIVQKNAAFSGKKSLFVNVLFRKVEFFGTTCVCIF